MNLSYHPAARAEVIEAAVWYAQQAGELLSAEFIAEVDAVVLLLGRHPAIGTPGARGRRVFRPTRFPYTVVYRIEADGLRVLALAHQSRRPGYWRQRG